MKNNIENKLFSEFNPSSTKQWDAIIQKDLKGADYEKKLIWDTNNGFRVKPYYREEDLQALQYLDSQAGEYPYVRGIENSIEWECRQDFYIDDISVANHKAVDALSKGANSIGFNTKNIEFKSQKDFSNLLKGISLEIIPIHFISGKNSVSVLSFLNQEIKILKLDKMKVCGSVNFDCLGFMTTKGIFFESEESDFVNLKNAIEFTKNNIPNFRVIAVSGNYIHNAGASVVQELAFALSMGNEYLFRLTDIAVSIEDVLKSIHFNFAIGSNYFLEIAKLRAARFLWAKIAEAFQPTDNNFVKMFIHTVTSSWNKTIYDPYVNLLRSTTETMSAMIGGTNSLSVKPFDMCYKKSDEFSERIALNQQIVLKEESYLGKVTDPSAGSYYIENLTNSIIDEAWNLFLMVEEKGGYIQAFKEGFIQDEIKKTSQHRDMSIAMRKDIFLGTNQYPNRLETEAENITLDCFNKGKGNILQPIATPLKQYRGAAAFEKIRLKTENYKGKKPVVFLLTFGNIGMRKARAAFASNFFACAGFQIVDNAGFASIEEGMAASIKAKSDIVVICSSDDEYASIVPQILEGLKDKTKVVLAGYPKNLVDTFKSLGLKYFIYSGMNALESLQDFQNELGIK